MWMAFSTCPRAPFLLYLAYTVFGSCYHQGLSEISGHAQEYYSNFVAYSVCSDMIQDPNLRYYIQR
jgi:hypothetical protein